MPAKKVITPGDRFGPLTVLNEEEHLKRHSKRKFRCLCDCGSVRTVEMAHFRAGTCGCRKHLTKHGHYSPDDEFFSEYNIWKGMLFRCEDKSNPRYGGRGISVCERWRSFENFIADMGERPDGTTLDRIDNDGDYEPANCRWATRADQARNRRTTFRVSIEGVERPLIEWCDIYGIGWSTARARIKKGWSPEQAVKTPVSSARRCSAN